MKRNAFPLIVVLCSILISYFYYFTDRAYFDQLVAEDGFFENLTSLFLFLTALFLGYIFFKYQSNHTSTWKIGLWIMIIGLIFGAGEEISWGQRIFAIDSTDFFKENNAQGETNLHNMVVGGVKVNKIIFSYLFSAVFGLYFMLSSLLYQKNKRIASLVNKFGIPIPTYIQCILFLVGTAAILSLDHSRKWEIWEFLFAFNIFTIFTHPFNKQEIQRGIRL